MEGFSADDSERYQFDYFCKLVLQHEARDYLRELKRLRSKEVPFYCLPQREWNNLVVIDHYPSNSTTFSACGYEMQINNDHVACAFSSLHPKDQSILILRYAIGLTDREIGIFIGLPRSTVQRRRTSTIIKLRKQLAIVDIGG